jgi:nucleotide-binding universal stress UspA family protein
MSYSNHSTVLVPLDVSSEENPHPDVLRLLKSVGVVLLGYYPVPSQAAPAQVKHQHEPEAEERLKEVADRFDTPEGDLTEVLVFTHDRQETVNRIADEHDCDAVLSIGQGSTVERILVPIRGRENLKRVLGLVEDLLSESAASTTLFHSVEEGSNRQEGEELLEEATRRLTEAGVRSEKISRRVSEGKDAKTEIAGMEEEFDVLVIGETKPSLRERILGAFPTQIIDQTEASVFVVRKTGTGAENDDHT